MPDNASVSPRSGKDLFDATIPFVEEFRTRSWWYVGSTLVVLAAVLTFAAVAPWWPVRLAASIAGGLVMVRAFILYHDFMHGSLLSRSRPAQVVFYLLGFADAHAPAPLAL
jgi:omega-6 fatty acid desaturase (delta-12 desaturase)